MNLECAEKFCKDCLDQMPEKEREVFIHNLEKICQDMKKGAETCCKNQCNCSK
jgi:hypothetical protein